MAVKNKKSFAWGYDFRARDFLREGKLFRAVSKTKILRGANRVGRCGQKVGLDTLKREIERCIQKNNITKLSRFMKRRNQ